MESREMFRSFAISGSGMTAEMQRMRVAAANIANAHATRTAEGGPYQPRRASLGSQDSFGKVLRGAATRMEQLGGVQVLSVAADPSATPRMVYDPHHPDAGPDGMVAYPAVEVPVEMMELLSAGRAYEANVTALEAAKRMMDLALEI